MESSNYTRSAAFSDCGTYRYMLEHRWSKDGDGAMVGFILLNPSTADAYKDDPTIRRCRGFAQEWGYAGMYIGNMLAYRATDPKELPDDISEAIGPHRDHYLQELCERSNIIVCAWGSSAPTLINRRVSIMTHQNILEDHNYLVYCLGRNGNGKPKHPLYLRKDSELEVYDGR